MVTILLEMKKNKSFEHKINFHGAGNRAIGAGLKLDHWAEIQVAAAGQKLSPLGGKYELFVPGRNLVQ
jgi:hypothetical protein